MSADSDAEQQRIQQQQRLQQQLGPEANALAQIFMGHITTNNRATNVRLDEIQNDFTIRIDTTAMRIDARVDSITERVAAFLKETVLEKHVGRTLLLVTHSVVIESLLATLRGDYYEGISMRRLAWIKCQVQPGGGLVFEDLDGFTFSKGLSMK